MLNRVTRSLTGTGVSVTYTRGGESAELVATPLAEGQDVAALPPPAGRSNVRERVYLIVYADLVDAGLNQPAAGDRITEIINGEDATFEVTPLRTEPAWRWADAQRTRVRVRCVPKAVSASSSSAG